MMMMTTTTTTTSSSTTTKGTALAISREMSQPTVEMETEMTVSFLLSNILSSSLLRTTSVTFNNGSQTFNIFPPEQHPWITP
jgi:hypothetical protein